jgi:hypothetical protein
LAEEFISKDSDIENNALLARNLHEDTLANQVLKNTGIPIPDKSATPARKEDFLNRIVSERYPEFKNPNVRVDDIIDAAGDYNKGKIRLDYGQLDDMTKATGKVLHEAGHRYDDEIVNFSGKNLDLKTLRDLKKSGFDLKNADPSQVYEMYAKGHHAEIPGLREGSYGLGALKNYLKKGSFRAVAPLLTGGAGLLASGASEAADTEEMGGASEQAALLREIDEANRRKKNLESSPEIQAASKKLYEEADTGKMFDPRRDALKNILRNRK